MVQPRLYTPASLGFSLAALTPDLFASQAKGKKKNPPADVRSAAKRTKSSSSPSQRSESGKQIRARTSAFFRTELSDAEQHRFDAIRSISTQLIRAHLAVLLEADNGVLYPPLPAWPRGFG